MKTNFRTVFCSSRLLGWLSALALVSGGVAHAEARPARAPAEVASSAVSFSPSGLHGAGFQNVVAASPQNNGLVLAGGDVAGIHRSTDWGAHWNTSNVGLSEFHVAAIAFSSTTPNKVYIGVGPVSAGGLFVSTDSGQSWSLVSKEVRFSAGDNRRTHGIPPTQPRTTGQLIQLDETPGAEHLYAGTFVDGVKRSDDGGKTWHALGLAGQHLFGIAREGTTVYAVTYEQGVFVCNHADMSNDPHCFVQLQGSTANPPAPTRGIELRVFDRALWVAADTQGVYRYLFSNQTWEKVPVPDTYAYVSVDGYHAHGHSFLFLGTMKAKGGSGTVLLRSVDGGPFANIVEQDHLHPNITGPGGEVWWHFKDKGNQPGQDGYVAADIQALPGHLLVAGRGGIWHTVTPEAAQPEWYPLVNHLEATINPSVAADPTRPGHVYVGNMDWTMLASRDRGITVERNRPDKSATVGEGVTVDPSNGEVYLAAGNRDDNLQGEVYVSANPLAAGGPNWRSTGLADAVSPGQPDQAQKPLSVVARGGTVLAAVNGSGIWRKVGNSPWTLVQDTGVMPERNGIGTSFSWAPASNTVYLYDGETGVWRSNSAGAANSWTLIWKHTASAKGSGYVLAESASRLWVSASDGLYLLEGANAGAVGSGITPVRKASSLHSPGPLVKTGGSVYVVDQVTDSASARLLRTQDGTHFEDVSDPVFRRTVGTADALAADGSSLYVALNGTGLLLGAIH